MQPIVASARAGFTERQVRAALTGPDQRWGCGVDLLSPDLTGVVDISAAVSKCTVSRDCTAAVHGSVNLTLTRELRWGADRVRPYLLLDSEAASVHGMRFDLGVYIPQTPKPDVSTSPVSWQVAGSDELSMLQYFLTDTVAIAAGENVLDKVRSLVALAGVQAPVRLDSSRADAVYPAGGKVWPFFPDQASTASTGGPYRYIDVINSLLATVGYIGLWADWEGRLRSQALLPAGVAPSEWMLDAADRQAGLISDRSADWDVWGANNRWTFYQSGIQGQPVDGVSAYTRDNLDEGPASQLKVGVRQAAPQSVDAADYAALVTQADAAIDAEIRGSRVLTLSTRKMPLFWHRDVVDFTDTAMGAHGWRLAGRTWQVALDDRSDEKSTWEVVAA